MRTSGAIAVMAITSRSAMKITPSCGIRDEHGAPRSVPIAVWILRALVIAARRARLKMDSEGGFLGDKRLVVVAIAIIDARVFQAIPTQRTIEIENSVRGGQH